MYCTALHIRRTRNVFCSCRRMTYDTVYVLLGIVYSTKSVQCRIQTSKAFFCLFMSAYRLPLTFEYILISDPGENIWMNLCHPAAQIRTVQSSVCTVYSVQCTVSVQGLTGSCCFSWLQSPADQDTGGSPRLPSAVRVSYGMFMSVDKSYHGLLSQGSTFDINLIFDLNTYNCQLEK